MPAAGNTHYEVLNTSQSASEQEIKRAFRRLALKHHPDREGGDAELFKRAVIAYEVLVDQQKRADYDTVLRRRTESNRKRSPAQSAAQFAHQTATQSNGDSMNSGSRQGNHGWSGWHFHGPSTRRSAAESSSGSASTNAFRRHRSSFSFPFPFSFDAFDFPDPPFMHTETDNPPPRRPRSSRFEQTRAGHNAFVFETSSDEGDGVDGSEDYWEDAIDDELRQAKAERRRATKERRRAEAERKMAESQHKRARTEHLKAIQEAARARADAERARIDVRLQSRRPAQEPTHSSSAAEQESVRSSPEAQIRVQTAERAQSFEAKRARKRADRTPDSPDDTYNSSDGVASAEPTPKRPRVEPDIVDLTGDEPTSKRKRSDSDTQFDMSDMRRVPPFTERHGTTFDLNGVSAAVPSRDEVRVRQQNRARSAQYLHQQDQRPQQQSGSPSSGATSAETNLWSAYVHESYELYDRLFRLHNQRNQLVDENAGREAMASNLRETAELLDTLLQGTQRCLS